MGKPVIRKGTDMTTGHGSWPPTIPVKGARTVFANGIPVVRQGDAYMVHCNKKNKCHVGMATSPATIYAEGKAIQRKGDPNTCGDTASNGSPNVRAG